MNTRDSTIIERDLPSRSVLFLSPTMAYNEEGLYTVQLVRSLHLHGHEVHLAAPPGPLHNKIENDEINVKILPFLEDQRLELFKTKRFRESFDESSLDLIHVSGTGLNSIAARLSQAFSVPYFLTVCLHREDETVRVDRHGGMAGVIVTSDAMREYAVNQLGIDRGLLEVIRPGVDLNSLQFSPIFLEGKQPILAMSTPLLEENRIHIYPEVARLLIQERGHDLTVLVLNQGPEEDELRRLVAERDLNENVVFQSNMDVYYDVLPDVDVLLNPEPNLSSGLLVLEAMACGKPVITSSAGAGYDVVLDENTGFLVSSDDDASTWADKTESLLADPDRGQEMGEHARKHVEENFELTRMTRETVDFYNREL